MNYKLKNKIFQLFLILDLASKQAYKSKFLKKKKTNDLFPYLIIRTKNYKKKSSY